MRWSFCVFGLVLTACGPGIPTTKEPPVEYDATRLGLERIMAATGNATAISSLLAPGMIFGGAWFPDPQCRKQFTKVGPVDPSWMRSFAQCLATLPWQASSRKTRFPDTLLLTYESGLELEVLLSREDQPRILWIGYVSRALATDNAPTVTQAALEARRIDPVPVTGKDALWAKVCIDETGAITSVRPDMVTAFEVQESLLSQVRQWRFKPFELDGLGAPICSVVRVGTADEHFDRVPPVYAGSEMQGITVDPRSLPLVEGTFVVVPDGDEKDRLYGQKGNVTLVVGLRYCTDATGRVTDIMITRASGFPGWDAKIVAAAKQWRFQPVPTTRVCTNTEFLYTQRG